MFVTTDSAAEDGTIGDSFRLESTDRLRLALERACEAGRFTEVEFADGPGYFVATATIRGNPRRAFFRVLPVAEASIESPRWQIQAAVELRLSERIDPERLEALLAWTRTALLAGL